MRNLMVNLLLDKKPSSFWSASRVVAAIATVLWMVMALTGCALVQGVRDQHVQGYPNDGQIRLYIVLPLIGLTSSAAIFGFASRLPGWLRRVVLCVDLLALLPVFLSFGG
jgi:hypothetical protein